MEGAGVASARTCWGAISPKRQVWANLSLPPPPKPKKVTEGRGEGDHGIEGLIERKGEKVLTVPDRYRQANSRK